jgi:uncharacterized protein YuzE
MSAINPLRESERCGSNVAVNVGRSGGIISFGIVNANLVPPLPW